jgi:peptidoglycan/xylan/chitin deacetylase (PgdA/CDA1 family)
MGSAQRTGATVPNRKLNYARTKTIVMQSATKLRVIAYRYVRDLQRTPFPCLSATLIEDFRTQVDELSSAFEMASIESAIDFLNGEYRPRRDLCLLTFDDGLREHYTTVMPILYEKRLRAVFFPITSCVAEQRVAPDHMSQFLMASMGFDRYADAFFREALTLAPDSFAPFHVDPLLAAQRYPWKTPEEARFKYLLNFGMDAELRDCSVRRLFTTHVAEEGEFAESLYMNWDQLRLMQKAGMCIGGHSHQHKALASMPSRELISDLETCRRLLNQNLAPQSVWPFSYPDGKRESFHIRAMRKLQELGFDCAFSTETSDNRRGADLYTLCRTQSRKALAREVSA